MGLKWLTTIIDAPTAGKWPLYLYLRCQTGCVHSKHSTTAFISLRYFKVNSATLSVYLSFSKFQQGLDKNMSVLRLQTVISRQCCPVVRLRSRLCPRSCCGHSVVAVYPIVFISPCCSCSEPTIAVLLPALGRRCWTVTRYSHLSLPPEWRRAGNVTCRLTASKLICCVRCLSPHPVIYLTFELQERFKFSFEFMNFSHLIFICIQQKYNWLTWWRDCEYITYFLKY